MTPPYNHPALVMERIKLLGEVNHVHTPIIISGFVCELFFVNFKGSKQLLLLLFTIKHRLYLVAALFTFHAEPAEYIVVKIFPYYSRKHPKNLQI